MKFKIDENLHVEFAAVLRVAGHDALSVWDEDLSGRPDAAIAAVCKDEDRALMSLDLDFCDVRQYPPSEFPGLVVFRVGRQD
jgi:predicted nuclease of predicted toxin-antitoxin system